MLAAQPDATAYAPPPFVAAPIDHPDADAAEPLRLDLPKTLQLAAQNNLDLVIARENVRISALLAEGAWGEFDPAVTGSYAYSDAVDIVGSLVEGMPDETFINRAHRASLRVGKRFSTGTEIGLALDNSRTQSRDASAVRPDNYAGILSIELTQPLLRGFAFDFRIPRLRVLTAHIALDRQRQTMRGAVIDIVARAESAYWAVVQALKAYDVRRRSVALAETQMALTRRKIRAGLVAPSEAIEAESAVADRALQLIENKRQIAEASDALRRILNLPTADWSRPLIPTDHPTFTPSPVALDSALEDALRKRPEARMVALRQQEAGYALDQAENAQLPRVDLGVNYSLSGQDDTLGGVYRDISDRNATRWGVNLSVTWNPLNTSANTDAEVARVEQRIARAQQDRQRLDILADVRGAVRDFEAARLQVLAAGRARDVAVRRLDAAQRKFQSGTSSNFDVSVRSRDVAEAELAELGALIALRRADVQFQRATGQLLDARRIVLE